eukprot:3232-Heterococcus_DN1.PRE.2
MASHTYSKLVQSTAGTCCSIASVQHSHVLAVSDSASLSAQCLRTQAASNCTKTEKSSCKLISDDVFYHTTAMRL